MMSILRFNLRWLSRNRNRLTIHPDKTKVMLFTHNHFFGPLGPIKLGHIMLLTEPDEEKRV